MITVKIDVNNPSFLKEWKTLQVREHSALTDAFIKIRKYNWMQLYTVKGLNWEKITSIDENNLYSFRFSQKYRVTGDRDGNYLVMVNLHTDHDSAYK